MTKTALDIVRLKELHRKELHRKELLSTSFVPIMHKANVLGLLDT